MDETTLRASLTVDSHVVVGLGALEGLPGIVEGLRPHNVLVAVDAGVPGGTVDGIVSGIADAGLDVTLLRLPGGEHAKGIGTLVELWEALAGAGATRRSVLVAVGGGSLLDVAGFAAATFMRGVRSVYVPTTTLAQVDASIGGKTGIDLGRWKNIVGAFHLPVYTVIDPLLLESLPGDVYASGFSEVVKHAVIKGPRALEWLRSMVPGILSRDMGVLEEVVRFSVSVKLEYIRRDYAERGARVILNFGHTLGHAVEAASGYRIPHGEAVSIGLVGESILAQRLLGLAGDSVDLIAEILGSLGLPTRVKAGPDELLQAMRVDKKFLDGKPRLPLPRSPGVFEVVETGWEVVERWLREISAA